jgi:hypothetical protein
MQAIHPSLHEDPINNYSAKVLVPEPVDQTPLTRKWNRIVLITSSITFALALCYFALSITAVAVQANYNMNNCVYEWMPYSGLMYNCGKDMNEDLLLYICHLLVSTLVLPIGLGLAMAGSINKLSNRAQINCSHIAIHLLGATLLATFVMMICSLKMIYYSAIGSGVLFAVCFIWTAILIPFLIKKISVTPRFAVDSMKNAELKEAHVVEKSDL